jgi:signal transduction histidine kinase
MAEQRLPEQVPRGELDVPAPGARAGANCTALAVVPVKVLLVADLPGDLLALESMLDGMGLDLVRAGSCAEAVQRLARDDFAVVLLDVRQAGADALETARGIRSRQKTRHLPIIFITTESTGFPADQAYQLGAVDYLLKPLLGVILRAKVLGFVELYHHREQLRRLEREAVERHMAEKALRAEAERERRHADELARLNDDLEREVAERRRAEEALREDDRRKDSFLAMLAHEMRNPLAPLRNALTLLCLSGEDEPVREQALAMAGRQVDQLTRLLDDLLDLARIRQGKMELRVERCDLNEIVARGVETVRLAVASRRHELEVRPSEQPVMLSADPARLQQVVVNLLTNACRYTDPGGKIAVRVALADSEAVLSVSDTGIGLSPEACATIFDLYAQTARARQRDQGGLGLGLALVRGLVLSHGGRIEARSEGPGRGSTFTVHLPRGLPIADCPSQIEKAEGAREAPSAPSPQSLRVLIVEDNEDAANSLAYLLRAWGHEARTARDGPAALGVAAAFPPQVAFVDIGLPGMDGFEVGSRLRKQAGANGLLLVALTGHGLESDRQKSEAHGFAHHLLKPVDPEALQALLAHLAAEAA